MKEPERIVLWAIWDACMPILAWLGFGLVSVAAYKSTIDSYKFNFMFIPGNGKDWFWAIFWLLILGLIIVLSIGRAITKYRKRKAEYQKRQHERGLEKHRSRLKANK